MRPLHLNMLVLAAILTAMLDNVTTHAATFAVVIMGGDFPKFSPANITIAPGDTVIWYWPSMICTHSVTSGSNCKPDGLFDSGTHSAANYTYSRTFNSPGTFPYFSSTECDKGTVGQITVAEVTLPAPQLLNVSTRLRVDTGENVLIGGFIITGTTPKKVLLRGIGPSLTGLGVGDALLDPLLELHAKDGSLIMTNDDWKTTQETEIEATGAAPTDDRESAMIATLNPDSYTAIVSGKNQSTGVGLVEAYDLDQAGDSQLANISTRGLVQTGSNVMIGGFILGDGTGVANILMRALGPSLSDSGINGVLADPTLELHDENGDLVVSNDNWKDTQEAEIAATGIPPQNDLESAMLVTISATAHTAIVSGKDGASGVALVEIYRLQ